MNRLRRLYSAFDTASGAVLPPLVLLLLRVQFGIQFFLTGKGKLAHLAGTSDFFAGLGIPAPRLAATLAGSVECIGGLLILAGLGTRLTAVPLAITMVVALATAHRADILGTDKEPVVGFVDTLDKIVTATPGPYLLAMLTLLAFGAGRFSLDALVSRRRAGKSA